MVGHFAQAIIRHVIDRDAKRLGRRQVDIVDAEAEAADRSALFELPQQLTRKFGEGHENGVGVARHGKTIGLVGGRGRIGQAVAARARGFAMRILYCGPRPMEPADESRLGAVYVPLERLLAESDFVSLHPQLTAATRHMIGARELGLMKPSAYLINTSRGAVVDEAALTAALAEKRIAGAGLDVFEHEPHVAPALTGLANLVVTPHLGSAVVEVRTAMAETVVDNIAAILAGRKPPNIVNPEALAS